MSPLLDDIELEARAEAVGQARRWLRSHLPDWSEEGVESAELVTSELVTNVVLHGRGPLRLAIGRRDERVLLEVLDRGTALPVVNHYTPGASTGRGLLVVDRLAVGWGLRTFPGGKAVWAVLCDQPLAPPAEPVETTLVPAQASERGEAPPEWPPPPDVAAPREPADAPPGYQVPVRILGLPVAAYLAAQEHNDALLRELRYLAEGQETPAAAAPLVSLGAELRTRFEEVVDLRSQVELAQREGRRTVDIEMSLPRTAWWSLTTFVQLLDEADELCEQGQLLTVASSPGLRRFRGWYLGEVLAQLEGADPSPWPYGDPDLAVEEGA